MLYQTPGFFSFVLRLSCLGAVHRALNSALFCVLIWSIFVNPDSERVLESFQGGFVSVQNGFLSLQNGLCNINFGKKFPRAQERESRRYCM